MSHRIHRAAACLLAAALVFCALPVQAMAWELPWAAVSRAEEERVTVRFDANGGVGSAPAPISGARGTQASLPAVQMEPPLGIPGLSFQGWSVQVSAAVPDYLPGDTVVLEQDMVLYAVYSTFQMHPPKNSNAQAQRPVQPPRQSGSFTLRTGSHQPYLSGYSDGLFHPSQALTRAELAQILASVVADRPSSAPSFSDVNPNAWYAPAVQAVAGLGILNGYADGTFRPDQPITRGESAEALVMLLPSRGESRSFGDVPKSHPNYDAICAAAGAGLFTGDQYGNFSPDGSLSRAQAAAAVNKLLGRDAEEGGVRCTGEALYFPDVPASHWAYAQVLEATAPHDHSASAASSWRTLQPRDTVLDDGFHRLEGRLYCVENGRFLCNATRGYFAFDSQGRYTTGDYTLDDWLNAIVEEQTDPSMTRDQKLRALFNYVRDNFSYLKRPHVSKGQTGWEPEYAAAFLNMKKGNCFSFSALYCLLARELGQPAYTVVGGLGKNASPHGWVEIELDGTTYMFDTQLEWRYLHDYGRKGYDLFKFKPENARFIYTR